MIYRKIIEEMVSNFYLQKAGDALVSLLLLQALIDSADYVPSRLLFSRTLRGVKFGFLFCGNKKRKQIKQLIIIISAIRHQLLNLGLPIWLPDRPVR